MFDSLSELIEKIHSSVRIEASELRQRELPTQMNGHCLTR